MEPEDTADDLKTAANRTTTTAATTPPPPPPPLRPSNQIHQSASNNSFKSREEGELSSSEENDDFPGGSASRFRGDGPAQRESVQVAPTNKNMAGKSALSAYHPSVVGVNSRNHVHSTHHKCPDKNRVPFVISFSDDDSGSEPEECEQRKEKEFRGNPREVDGSIRPPLEKPKMPLRSAGNDTSKMPRQMSLSRTFVSSMTRVNGTSSKNSGMSAVLRSRLENASTLDKSKAGQSGVLTSSKLHDLRQLIAIRENELKLKAAKHRNEIASILSKDQTVLSVRNHAVRNRDSVDFLHLESEGQKKRLRVSEPLSSTPNMDDRQYKPATQLVVVSEKSAPEKFGQQRGDDCRSCDKEILSGRTRSSATQRKNQLKNHNSSSDNLPNGADLVTNSSQCMRITELAEPSAAAANRSSKTSPKKLLTAVVNHPGKLNSQHGSGSNMNSTVLKEPRHGHNLTKNNLLKEGISSKRIAKRKSNNAGLTCDAPDSILERPDAHATNSSLGNINISEAGDMDIQSLLEIEELQDKELEEAQELRHKCEVEERNALKAYRKAQRALAEANARCSYLYRKRELFSAHFRSRMMEDSSLSWLTGPHNHNGASVSSLINISEDNTNLGPGSSHEMQAEFDLNGADGAVENLTDPHEDGENVASEPCSESDASTSEQEDNGTANALGSPSMEMDISADEGEESFPVHLKAGKARLDCERQEGSNDRTRDANAGPNTIVTSEDSLLLEAALRSQLFAKLGTKNLLKQGSSGSVEPAVENEAQNSGKQMGGTENIPAAEAEKDRPINSGGIDSSEKSNSENPVETKKQGHVGKFCSNYESSSRDVPLGSFSITSTPYLCPLVRSAVSYLKDPAAINSTKSQTINMQIQSTEMDGENGNGVGEIGTTVTLLNFMECSSMNMCVSKGGSYTSSLAIDPFWPLCMYELRGKCNDDECVWQHVRDYSSGSSNSGKSNSADCLAESPLHSEKYHGATNPSKRISSLPLAPPTYLVSLDTLKADFKPYKYGLLEIVGRRWQKCFSAYLVLSNVLPSDLRSDESCLHGLEARIEVQMGWNRQSSYFHSRTGTMSQVDEHTADSDQALESALLSFNREVSKQNGRIEALKVLSRAIEANPTSAALWVVYLHVYYSNERSIGKDDLFQVAVEHNVLSYELWLLYINSREKLNDRLVAFDTALSVLCQQASASDSHALASSQWILDLFLQMLNFLCISGEVGKAIHKIYGLFTSTKNSIDPHELSLPDIPTFLTIYDKCVFWVSCVYLVMYKKLPDALVQHFEYQKELSAVDWPSIYITFDEKQQAVTLMESVVESLELYIDSESLECETTLKAAHSFALNHIKCIAVLEGLECSKNLLEKYTKLYPSCLELVLMSARSEDYENGNQTLAGFEEALSNWMEGVPGVQCIWNQYAECALRNGRFEFAKELLERWFHSVWEVRCSQSEISDHDTDAVFGLLTLSLYKLFQNEHTEARSIIERALKVASAEDYKHSVREHAMFLLKDCSNFKEAPLLKILKDYLLDSRALPVSEPFSRKFIEGIKKPRVQQLVNNLFAPVSSNSSLVNLVLESCYGPSLLPQVSAKLTDLVDFVEAMMEIAPANYQLAISVCKFLSNARDSVAVNASVSFWASSLLIDSLFQAVPVAPEYIWVEAAQILQTLTDIRPITESFQKRALSVYPFSINLWKSYLSLSRNTGNVDAVIAAARERGMKLD